MRRLMRSRLSLSNGESETLEFEETTGTRREAIVMVCPIP